MNQDNEKTSEQPSTSNTGSPWHIQNPDGSVHGGNGIQPGSHDTPADDSQDEPLTE